MKKQLNWTRVLPVAAALAQGGQYFRLGKLIDSAASGYLFGVLGVVVNLSLVSIAVKLPRIKAKAARRWTTAVFVCLMVVTPVLITSVNLVTMDAGVSNPILRFLIALTSASLVDLAIVGAGFSDGSLLPSDAGSDTSAKAATLSAKRERKPYKCECGAAFANRYKFSGHQGKCPKHKELHNV